MKESTQPERSTEELQTIKTLLGMYRNGIQQKDLIGYHGLQLEAIEYLLQQGNIPGNTISDDVTPDGALYFAATTQDPFQAYIKQHGPDRLQFVGQYQVWHSSEKGFQKASRFARGNAPVRRLITLLHLDQTDDKAATASFDLLCATPTPRIERRKAGQSFFNQEGITDKQIAQALHGARKMKGIVFGVRKNIIEDFPIVTAHGLEDYGVVSPHGFSLDYFTGLQCLGPEEDAFFKDLDRRFGHLQNSSSESIRK